MQAIQRALLTTSLSLALNTWAEEHSHEMHDHGDNPLLTYVLIDQLETQTHNENANITLEGQAWIGKDKDKLWLKTDVTQQDGTTEEAELQVLYSRALTPFWDLQSGLLHTWQTHDKAQDWFALGLRGLAPYWVEIDSAVFIQQSGAVALGFKAEYELLFTQQLILSTSGEVKMFGQNDAAHGYGAGLSEATAGARLRYEIRREFAPYIGLTQTKLFGKSAEYAEEQGAAVSKTQWVAGLRAWF
ncbi:MAG: CopB-like protein [Pseudomonadota bacterium]|jgi:copper resistance protein B